jgi:hypothetical protein
MNVRWYFVPIVLLMLTACDDLPSTMPTPPVQIGGMWNYTFTLTSASATDCIAAALNSLAGRIENGTIDVTQSGTALTARLTDSVGSTCDYNGSAGQSSFALNSTRCSPATLSDLSCLTGGRRDLEFVSSAINATVNGNTATGTNVEIWNVFIGGSRVGVGTVTINSGFRATHR